MRAQRFLIPVYLILAMIALSGIENISRAQRSSSPQRKASTRVVYPQVASSAFIGPDGSWLVVPLLKAVLQTTDGGRSWKKRSSNVVQKKTAISFIDQNLGWCVNKNDGVGQVWRTTDGGRNWTRIGTIAKNDGAEPFITAQQLKFVDKLHGWLIETFSVWRTADGGATWNEVLSTADPRFTAQPSCGFFVNESEAWVCAGPGQLYRTTNGGKTWEVRTVAEGPVFSDIFFVDESTGWLSRNYRSQLYRTDDGGRSWQLQPPLGQDMYIDACFFLTKDEGWGVGQQLLEGSKGMLPIDFMEKGLVQAILLHTVDGGKTWQPALIERDEPAFTRVHFSDAEHGWLLSFSRLYRTTDGGQSWQVVRSNIGGD